MIHTTKSAHYTPHALRTFFAETPFSSEDSFLLVDNDRSLDLEYIKSNFPHVAIEVRESPCSFAANMNLGMKRALERGMDFISLNNDIIFTRNWFVPLCKNVLGLFFPLSNAQLEYKVGSFQCRVSMQLEEYLNHQQELAAIVQQHQQKNRGVYQLAHTVPFYCVRIPHAVISRVGLLEEGLSEAGWEDIDYILRCWEEGIPLFYAAESFILHFYGKSTWSVDGVTHQPEADEVRFFVPEKFKETWGRDLADAFSFQTPRGQALKVEAETRGRILGYQQLVRSLKTKK